MTVYLLIYEERIQYESDVVAVVGVYESEAAGLLERDRVRDMPREDAQAFLLQAGSGHYPEDYKYESNWGVRAYEVQS